MTRILLVDDQSLVRVGFRTILESEPGFEVVGEAADGQVAVEQASALQPDVICMDVQMPVMDGLEATRRICSGGHHAAVMILTTFDRDDFLYDALDAGASGFLLKTAEPEQLIEAVHALARGDALLSPEVTRRVIERYARPGAGAGRPGPDAAPAAPAALEGLTEREREVLLLLARGASNAEMAAELFLGEATIKTHVSNVLMKLGVRDRIHAVIWAYEHGVVTPAG
ncbi:MAG TPA: response regulator transcription factor [Actinotalea caeni]|uniref:response regulator n=1 Tax=Actinotalea caeni TaxID=1348467 RepID=UPI0012E0E056|nr:response regulator transcription factor [Actinotalea caeni]HLV54978.1 response regulator transcription factor [Actinotalea caeni]